MSLPVADQSGTPAFLYTTCQVGAERALKAEVARDWPGFHLAFSRPGFLTFKLPPGFRPADVSDLAPVFARAHGYSLGKVAAPDDAAGTAEVWALVGEQTFGALHVWQRDTARPGWRGFEPGRTSAAVAAEAALLQAAPPKVHDVGLVRIAQCGMRVLDVVLVEPQQWWIGWHVARGESCFPGGLRELELPPQAVSRAYVKMAEALAWSGLPVERGQKIAELGCAPGGASQALLASGLEVIGIDPALVDPRVLADAHFTHVRKRADDVRRREFRGITWLAADMNVAPETTLDTVEAIVTHQAVAIRGLLLTLKLLDWSMAAEIPQYLARIRGWGYTGVRARQLAYNRQEVCVTAVRKAAKKKPGRR